MKNGLYTLVVSLLTISGCRNHVYHTYYGDIDTDTMEVGLTDTDGSPCYQVKYIDSITVENTEDYAGHGPIIYYYNPKKDIYYVEFPTHDEHGNAICETNPFANQLIEKNR